MLRTVRVAISFTEMDVDDCFAISACVTEVRVVLIQLLFQVIGVHRVVIFAFLVEQFG